MVTWLTRSLAFIIAGAILAFAITTHHLTFDHAKVSIDLQTVGVILLLVGIFDLLLNFGVLMYAREPMRSVDPYAAARAASAGSRPAGPAYPDRAGEPVHETRVIDRDNPNWH